VVPERMVSTPAVVPAEMSTSPKVTVLTLEFSIVRVAAPALGVILPVTVKLLATAATGVAASAKRRFPVSKIGAEMVLTAPAVPALLMVAPFNARLPPLVPMVVAPGVALVSPRVRRVVNGFAKVVEMFTVCDTPPKSPVTLAISPAAVPGLPPPPHVAGVFQSWVPPGVRV